MRFLTTLVLLLCFTSESSAGLFKIINRNYGSAGAYQSEIDPVFDALEATVNALLPLSDNSTFMASMANNAMLSGASNSANYGSPIEIFEAGAHAGLSIQSAQAPAGSKLDLNLIGGFGAQATARAGVHLSKFADSWGPFDLKKAWLYAGAFTYDFSQGETTFRFGAATVYGQYQLYESAGILANALKWNGLNVGTGLRYVSMKVNVTKAVTETTSQVMPTMPGSPTVTTTYNGTLNFGADISTWSIPVEISTSARVLYFFTPFFGLGTDINIGKAKSIANLTGPVTVTESSASYGTMGGDASLDLGEEGSPRTLALRTFSGIQIEAGVASFSITTTKSIPAKDTAVNLGFRMYW